MCFGASLNGLKGGGGWGGWGGEGVQRPPFANTMIA